MPLKKTKTKSTSRASDLSKFFPLLLTNFEERSEFSHKDKVTKGIMAERCQDLLEVLKTKNKDKTISIEPQDGLIRIILINKNRKFLLEGLRYLLRGKGVDIMFISHPVLTMKYKGDKLSSLEVTEMLKDQGPDVYSIIYAILNCPISEAKSLKAQVGKILNRIERMTEDYPHIIGRISKIIENIKKVKDPKHDNSRLIVREFLHWICQDNFIFLGMTTYKVAKNKAQLLKESCLGINCLEPELLSNSITTDRISQFIKSKELLEVTSRPDQYTYISKESCLSYIFAKEDGNIICILGIFTSIAYRKPVQEVPYLNNKMNKIIEKGSLIYSSHDQRLLKRTLERYPREELFESPIEEIYSSANHLMNAEVMPNCRVHVRRSKIGRFIYCLVAIPKILYSENALIKLQKLLYSKFETKHHSLTTEIFESQMAIAYFKMEKLEKRPIPKGKNASGAKPSAAAMGLNAPIASQQYKSFIANLEKEIDTLLQDWYSIYLQALKERHSNLKALEIYDNNRPRLSYTDAFTPEDAIEDIDKIYINPKLVHFYKNKDDEEDVLRLKIFLKEGTLPLSVSVAHLAKMGFLTLEEVPYKFLNKNSEVSAYIHCFKLRTVKQVKKMEKHIPLIEECMMNLLRKSPKKEAELNNLVLEVGLHWNELELIKAYCAYLKQLRYPIPTHAISSVLAASPEITRSIVNLFELRFHPKNHNDKKEDLLHKKILKDLVQVEDPTDDKVLRAFLTLIFATKRTNFYNNMDYTVLKIAACEVPFAGVTNTLEIFVYSEAVEGIHLRESRIARGGIRWSDRLQDYRTEALELQQTQSVKNAIIIPQGAKGTFCPTPDPNKTFDELGIDAYKTFITGLLEVTDNLKKGELHYNKNSVIRPKLVVCKDGYDPYLVVAPDKGTAKFSNLANELSQDANFWMSDAFASGGKNGYDHKAMGITAKGAWVSIKHHFHRLGMNMSDTFTVVGCGDMSGDVFGNGMLLSKHLKLIAAFDHRDIFIDPNPNPAESWKERSRLFKLPSSSWRDYNPKLISKGGGVFSRRQKRIELSKEACDLLNISSKSLTPQELISALLKAKVDLLWFGGIGTYVKSIYETQEEVNDNSNISIRINAYDLNCKIIGEGANLAMTEHARIDASLSGVELNTDFLDNSGGVNCSDYEVNLKLLFKRIMDDGKLTREKRNKILALIEESVSEDVLLNNLRQNQSVTLAYEGPKQTMIEVLNYLEEHGLDRHDCMLPKNKDLAARHMARPELCATLSHTKKLLKKKIIEEEVVKKLPRYILDQCALGYFHKDIRAKYQDYIVSHPLYERIVASVITNDIIDIVGMGTILHLQRKPIEKLIISFMISSKLFDTVENWAKVENSNMPWDKQSEQFMKLRSTIHRSLQYFLYCVPDLEKSMGQIDLYKQNLAQLNKISSIVSDKNSDKALDYINVIKVSDPKNIKNIARNYKDFMDYTSVNKFLSFVYMSKSTNKWSQLLTTTLQTKAIKSISGITNILQTLDQFKHVLENQHIAKEIKILKSLSEAFQQETNPSLEQCCVILFQLERVLKFLKKY